MDQAAPGPTRSALCLSLAALLAATVLVPSVAAGPEPSGSLEGQLAAFRAEVDGAVEAYTQAYHDFQTAPNASAKQAARQAMVAAGHRVGEAFLAFERGHGDNGSLSVFMQTQMSQGFYRSFEQDVVLLRATMLDAKSGAPPSPEEVRTHASPVRQALDRAESCLPEGCGSMLAGAGVQSFFVLLREGFEAILLVGAIVAYLHKSDRSHKTKHVYAGVGAAIAATLAAWFAMDLAFEATAARSSFAHAVLEGATLLLASLVLFYVGFWLLSKVESRRWREFIDGKLEDSLADDRSWMLGLVGFLAVFREGVETVLFVQAIALGSGGAWGQIGLGLLVGAAALAGLYYAVHRAGAKVPLRSFFAVTSAVLLALSVRFLGLGLFELQEAGLLAVTSLPGWLAAWTSGPLTEVLLSLAGFAPTLEVALAQGLLLTVVGAGIAWTFMIRPIRAQAAAS